VLAANAHTLLEPDGATVFGVEDALSLLYQPCLQEHLERVLKVQEYGRCSALFVEPVEGAHPALQRSDGLRL
jgi:hypothetical protein